MNANPPHTTLTRIEHCVPVHSLTDSSVTLANSVPKPDDLSSCSLSPTQIQQLQQLLHDCADLFVTSGGSLGCTDVVIHKIQTSGTPICQAILVALKKRWTHKLKPCYSTILSNQVVVPGLTP